MAEESAVNYWEVRRGRRAFGRHVYLHRNTVMLHLIRLRKQCSLPAYYDINP